MKYMPMDTEKAGAGLPSLGLGSQERATVSLLACGVVAGPLFLLIFAIQAFTRTEFQFTRSEPSLLSIGPWGWLQIANSVIGGVLVIVAALGLRRVLRASKGRFWGPLLLGVFGFCQVGVGVFVVDPIRSPETMTFHGTMHLVFGGIGFTALMVACFVFVRTFASLRQMPWAVFCAITGLLFLSAFLSAAKVSQSASSIQLFLNLIWLLEWVWPSLVLNQFMRNILRGRGQTSSEFSVPRS